MRWRAWGRGEAPRVLAWPGVRPHRWKRNAASRVPGARWCAGLGQGDRFTPLPLAAGGVQGVGVQAPHSLDILPVWPDGIHRGWDGPEGQSPRSNASLPRPLNRRARLPSGGSDGGSIHPFPTRADNLHAGFCESAGIARQIASPPFQKCRIALELSYSFGARDRNEGCQGRGPGPTHLESRWGAWAPDSCCAASGMTAAGSHTRLCAALNDGGG
jgi:hypothetical protein